MTENFLPSPQLNSIIEATNSAELTISGFAPSNHEIEIQLNSDPLIICQSDAGGKFEQKIKLTLGDNEIVAYTKDKDTTSQPSKHLSIYYNDIPPELEITEPEADKLFKRNPLIEIKGKTNKNCRVYINNHMVVTDNEGSFTYQTKLNEGENIFKVSSIDLANNKSEKEFKLRFQKY